LPLGDDDKKQLARFEDQVIDRLFVLNAQRAEEEKRAGLAAGAKQKGLGRRRLPGRRARRRKRKGRSASRSRSGTSSVRGCGRRIPLRGAELNAQDTGLARGWLGVDDVARRVTTHVGRNSPTRVASDQRLKRDR
jgi:hypothetical protein